MQLKKITTFLEEWAPPALQEDYDNSGLLAGDPESEISEALISLDVTEEVLDEAISKGCNLIISHHPVIFGGLKKLTGSNYVERIVIKALKNDIALYAFHTNLDNIQNGVNAMICEKLGLKECSVLSPKKQLLKKIYTFCPYDHAEQVRQALFNAGAGHIGNYSETSYNLEGTGTFKGGEGTDPFVGEKGKRHFEPEIKIETIFPAFLEKKIISGLIEAHPYEEPAYDIIVLGNKADQYGSGMIGKLRHSQKELDFLKSVKKTMKADGIRYTAPLGKEISSVAVCGGSGSFLLKDAIKAGADVFITGDFKYHQFFDAEGKILIADIGHYESEQFTPELIRQELKENFPNFAVNLSEINTNPVNYI